MNDFASTGNSEGLLQTYYPDAVSKSLKKRRETLYTDRTGDEPGDSGYKKEKEE